MRYEAEVSGTFDPTLTARRLAAAAPDVSIPCPRCGVIVAGSRLAAHLEKHAGEPTGWSACRGEEHASERVALAVGVGSVVCGGVAIALSPGADRLILGFVALGLSIALAIAMLGMLGRLSGSLTLEADQLVLRHTWDHVSRRVTLSSLTVRRGTLVELRPRVPGGPFSENDPHDEVVVGDYLELHDGRTRMRIGSRGGRSKSASWLTLEEPRRPRRSSIDLIIGPSDRAALEYLLVERGRVSSRPL